MTGRNRPTAYDPEPGARVVVVVAPAPGKVVRAIRGEPTKYVIRLDSGSVITCGGDVVQPEVPDAG